MAQNGAAIGRECSYEVIAAVSALSQLTDSGLVLRRGTASEATYTFKHALVQDVAYNSALKNRRQEPHAKIGRVIEERLPNLKDTDPEVMVHHYTQVSELPRAIPLWREGGSWCSSAWRPTMRSHI